MDPDIKEFLLAGMMLTKHSNTAKPRPRHLYMTPDCKRLCWRSADAKELAPSQQMRIATLASVETGRCSKPLNRKALLSKKYLAEKEECLFAIFGGVSSAKKETRMQVRRITLTARTAPL